MPPEIHRTIVNRGSINIKQRGLLAFVAPGVENSGIINAKLGQISLASGKTFTLDLYGDKLVSLGIDSKILNQVEWSTDGDIEHRNFCRYIGKYGKILVVPKIITRVIIPQHILNHLTKIYDDAIAKQWKTFLAAE